MSDTENIEAQTFINRYGVTADVSIDISLRTIVLKVQFVSKEGEAKYAEKHYRSFPGQTMWQENVKHLKELIGEADEIEDYLTGYLDFEKCNAKLVVEEMYNILDALADDQLLGGTGQ